MIDSPNIIIIADINLIMPHKTDAPKTKRLYIKIQDRTVIH